MSYIFALIIFDLLDETVWMRYNSQHIRSDKARDTGIRRYWEANKSTCQPPQDHGKVGIL